MECVCFVCFEWMLCCDVVCEKKIKNVFDKKKKSQVLNRKNIETIWSFLSEMLIV